MTLRHGNRIRQHGGEQVVRDLQAIEAFELGDSRPAERRIEERAGDVRFKRHGVSANRGVDWRRFERERRARTGNASWRSGPSPLLALSL